MGMHIDDLTAVSALISSADGSAIRQEFAQRIIETRALLRGHFLLQSEQHCAYFLRTAQLLYRAADGELFAEALVHSVRHLGATRILALESGSAFLAQPLASALRIKLTLVSVDRRKKPTAEILGTPLQVGEEVLVVADHVTTAASYAAVVGVAEAAGSKVVGGAALSVLGEAWLAKPDHVALLRANWQVALVDACLACQAGEPLWPAYEFA